jgi:Pyridoxamine 5'-phosphate oxidase
MSRLLGASLPSELVRRLDGSDLERYSSLAIPVATTDGEGWPHVALLSYSEVIAVSPSLLRVAIGSSSTTAGNLRRTGQVTIVVVDTGLVQYVKGSARERKPALDAAPSNAMFDVAVRAVLDDIADPQREGGARVLGGITVAADDAWRRSRAAVLDELLAAGGR